ncbi:MAG TPA: hypothetical protein VFV27_04395 [Nevskiaceae bacterium]|nr:hypothetical protein [Nevskiaceae bacterium]
MKTQALVVADDPVYANWLQNAVQGLEVSLLRPLDVEDLVSQVQAAGRVDLVGFQFSRGETARQSQWLERLSERLPELPVVGLGESGDTELMLSAMRAGARDFFVLQRDDANVAALMGKLLRRSAAVSVASSRRQGKLFTLFSGHPYDGIAFLGEHLALALAERAASAERTLLIDLASPPGAAHVFLNLNAGYSLLDAVNDVARCDQTLVDTAFPRHPSGLYVIGLPEDLLGRPLLDPDELLKLVSILRGLFAQVVVTADGHLPIELLRGLVGQSERCLLLSDQSILKSRHNKHLLRALRLDDTPLDHAGLVVDNYRRQLGLEPENLAELLDLPLVATLATQSTHRIQSMNAGEPLFTLAPKDPFCTDCRRLAEALLSGERQPAIRSEGGWLAKLLG